MTQDEFIQNLMFKAEENKRREEMEILRYSKDLMVGTIFAQRMWNMTIYYKITSLHPIYSNYAICSLLSCEKDEDGNIKRGVYITDTDFDLNNLVSDREKYERVDEKELAEVVDALRKAMLSTMC